MWKPFGPRSSWSRNGLIFALIENTHYYYYSSVQGKRFVACFYWKQALPVALAFDRILFAGLPPFAGISLENCNHWTCLRRPHLNFAVACVNFKRATGRFGPVWKRLHTVEAIRAKPEKIALNLHWEERTSIEKTQSDCIETLSRNSTEMVRKKADTLRLVKLRQRKNPRTREC